MLVAGIAGTLFYFADRFAKGGRGRKEDWFEKEWGGLPRKLGEPAGSDLRLEKCAKVVARAPPTCRTFLSWREIDAGAVRGWSPEGVRRGKLSTRRMRTVQFCCFAKLHAAPDAWRVFPDGLGPGVKCKIGNRSCENDPSQVLGDRSTFLGDIAFGDRSGLSRYVYLLYLEGIFARLTGSFDNRIYTE